MTIALRRDGLREFPMAGPQTSDTVVAPRVRRGIIFAAFACGLMILALVAFSGVGRWLVVEDSVAKARAIAVLSGRMPLRALEAAKLYRQGYAPEVWLTRTSEPGESLKEMGIAFEEKKFFDPGHWWRNSGDALDVVREVLGLMSLCRPASHT